MFAYRSWTETAIRMLLVAVFLFNAFAPVATVNAGSISEESQSEAFTPNPVRPGQVSGYAQTTPHGLRSSQGDPKVDILYQADAPTETPTSTETPTPEPSLTPTNTETATLIPSPANTEITASETSSTPESTATPSFTPTVAGETPLLSYKLTVKPEQVAAGDDVTFTIEIINNGKAVATGLRFSNTLPEYFESGQAGFKDFNFDPRNRRLVWDGTKLKAGKRGAELPPGETLTIEYAVKIAANSPEGQIVDTATLMANGFHAPLLTEATLTILESEKKLTFVDAKGGKATGLGGRVKVAVPDQSLNTASTILITDLSQKEEFRAKTADKPWVVFSLDMSLPRSEDVRLLTAPVIDEVTTQSEMEVSPAPDGSENNIIEPTGKISDDSLTLKSTATPNPKKEQPGQEHDRLIPFKTTEAKFNKPVELTISFDGITDLATLGADQTPFLVTLDETSGTWVRIPLKSIDYEAKTITAEITHFSIWGAGIGPSFPGGNVLLFDSAYPQLFTGNSRFSIPIWTPPGRNGMAPSLALSYSGGVVNGIKGDVQAPWVGLGWNVDTVEIARMITSNTDNEPPRYGYENKFLLLFNGTGYELIPDGGTLGRYHTKEESFLYIQLHNDSLLNNSPAALNATGEWWEVVERDGTRWRLGWTTASEQLAAMKGYPGSATGAWAPLGYAGHAVNVVALRWRADQVIDTFGNKMTSTYYEEIRLIAGTSTYYDRANYLDTITYTQYISGNLPPGYSVVFVRESRNGIDIPDPDFLIEDENWDTYRLDRIEIKYGVNVIRTYDLSYEIRTAYPNGILMETTVLSSVTVSGGGISAPTTTFSYIDLSPALGASGPDVKYHPYLLTITNGWGGSATYTYASDGRSADHLNWRVETLDISDGVSPSPMKMVYVYSGPCYHREDLQPWCNSLQYGDLVGHAQTTATTKDFNGTTVLASEVHKFYTDEQRAGREYEAQTQNTYGMILKQTSTTYIVNTTGLPSGGFFTYASAVEGYAAQGSSLVRLSKTEYDYDTTTGNLIHEREYDGTPTLYRQTDYEYITNVSSSYWILDTLSRRTLKDASGTVISKEEYAYDGFIPGSGSPPTVGKLNVDRIVDGPRTIDHQYFYDTYGNVTTTHVFINYGVAGNSPSGVVNIYTTSYDTALQTYVTSIKPPLIPATITDYDYGLGLPTSVTDPNGNTTTTTYDGLGRITSVTYPGSDRVNVKYTYPAPPIGAPSWLQMEFWDQPASVYRSSWEILDGLGRVIQTQSPYETAGYLVVADTSYNALGLTLYSGLPRTVSGSGGSLFTQSWGSLPHTTTTYDSLERPTLIGYPDGSHESFDYIGLRRVKVDRNNHQNIEEKDSFGRLVKVEEYTGSNPYTLYATTSYTYDQRDLLKTVVDAAGNQTTINYDGFGRKIEMSDPDLGNWRYRYNAVVLTAQIDAKRQAINMYYDVLNRLIGKTYATGPVNPDTYQPPADPYYSGYTVKYYYDAGANGMGHRTSMEDASGTTTWTYNEWGQVTNETRNVDGTVYSLSTALDAFGRPLSQALPSGETLNYSYNAMGTLSSLTAGTNTYASQIHYAASGQITDQLLGNNLRQQSCYDANSLRPTSVRVYSGTLQACGSNPSNPSLNLSYTYQPNGNVRQMVDATRGETLDYTYDDLDRLLDINGSYTQSYDYNTIGNITSKGTSETTSVISLTSVTSGFNHSCALTNGGGVVCWGNNDFGQLGDGTYTTRLTPITVKGLNSNVLAIEAGGFHTCALTTSGVKCWGHNGSGQLGDNTTSTKSNVPVNVYGLSSGATAISAGYLHTCALMSGGGVKCWGSNSDGQLGNNDPNRAVKRAPVDVSGLTGVTAITAGARHTCAKINTGGAKCWGQNTSRQLGDGSTDNYKLVPVTVLNLTNVVAISAGESHTCALVTGGGVKCWGANGNGQLGDGTTNPHPTPADVSNLTNATAISAGNFHTCALTTGGGMKCWGNNGYGRLGDGTADQRPTPVSVTGLTSGVTLMAPGLSHTCALTAGGRVKCWGENNTFGRLGDGTTIERRTATYISGLINGGNPIEAGGFHTCALTSTGGVKCWGQNVYGQLGDNSNTQRTNPVAVYGLSSGVIAITAGYQHTCALMATGGVKCWGGNSEGQLGNNDSTRTNRNTPVDVSGLTGAIAIAAGTKHTCALINDGTVKCWGDNYNYQLGDGSGIDKPVPVTVANLTDAVGVSAGESHTCAVILNAGLYGSVKCWGFNADGQLGDNSYTQRTAPAQVYGLSSGVAAISAGNFHTCALTTGGGVKCWGNNGNGRLGDGTTNRSNVPVNVNGLTNTATTVVAGISQTCAQTDTNGMKCWGYNTDGRLGDGSIVEHRTPVDVYGFSTGVVIAVTTGFNQSCALTSDGQKCWGSNAYGQVGDGGALDQRLMPVSVITGSLASYTYGDSAHKHAVSALSSGETYAYDANGNMITRVEGGVTYTQAFDIENRLISVTVSGSGQVTQFVYDGDGNLIKKIKPDGSRTIYVGGVYEEDRNSGGSVTRRVTYYPAASAMRIDNNVYYISDDLLNSASVVTDSTGTIVGVQRYYPYGETRYASGSMFTDRLFTGQREMAGLGIYDFGARFYSPKLGRFLSPDSIIPNTAKPQAFNRYAYALNNPVRYNDPTGHWIETALDIAFIGYDIYDIAHNGLNWVNGISLAADVACAILPIATGGGVAVRAIAHADDAVKVISHADEVVKVVSHADEALRAVKSVDKIADTAKTVEKVDIIKDLSAGTQQTKKIAKAIESGKIKVNFLGDELFEKAVKAFDPAFTGSAKNVAAMNRGSSVYLRKASEDIFRDAVHEGTHALDWLERLSKPIKSVESLEKRAYFFERQFQLLKGRYTEFKTLTDILTHIAKWY